MIQNIKTDIRLDIRPVKSAVESKIYRSVALASNIGEGTTLKQRMADPARGQLQMITLPAVPENRNELELTPFVSEPLTDKNGELYPLQDTNTELSRGSALSFPNADFSEMDMSGLNLIQDTNTKLSRGSALSFPNADFSEMDMSGLNLSNADLTGANLSRADLQGTQLQYSNLSNANLNDANLSSADLEETNLNKTDLSNADLTGANLSRADLSEANLEETNLRQAKLYTSFFTKANLTGAKLQYADLTEANLEETNLNRTDLSNANLHYANLTQANLTGANLTDTSFESANLTQAIIYDANLEGVNLTNANLDRAILMVGKKSKYDLLLRLAKAEPLSLASVKLNSPFQEKKCIQFISYCESIIDPTCHNPEAVEWIGNVYSALLKIRESINL